MKRYLDMGDRIELAKAAMEFADKYGLRPVQLYNAMMEPVTEELEPRMDTDAHG